MSSFAVMVTADPELSHEAHLSALSFCNAVLDVGHTLTLVFFYNAAVRAADQAKTAQSRELSRAWQALSERAAQPLIACISAAERREITADALAAGFELAGLGQLADAALRADRTVTFAG